ncbi:hypothetical protein I302_105018 [Kwoniella bestiolae CBS 10118]|uniref:Uncharacterized protein n=1 Tax=Kwoniella bestiolae CBS 10118 TaxID=1296100 RepID=A0A1B9FR44_9TREE|nr:hypothetical protein I302_08909 [Kwoniella bestiolae CBS 10118]OCF21237.1 hypothetical protein I302_08909 [Kwoniella bestiolae CBS 10118]
MVRNCEGDGLYIHSGVTLSRAHDGCHRDKWSRTLFSDIRQFVRTFTGHDNWGARTYTLKRPDDQLHVSPPPTNVQSPQPVLQLRQQTASMNAQISQPVLKLRQHNAVGSFAASAQSDSPERDRVRARPTGWLSQKDDSVCTRISYVHDALDGKWRLRAHLFNLEELMNTTPDKLYEANYRELERAGMTEERWREGRPKAAATLSTEPISIPNKMHEVLSSDPHSALTLTFRPEINGDSIRYTGEICNGTTARQIGNGPSGSVFFQPS